MLKRTLFFVAIFVISASQLLALNFDPPLNQGIEFPVTRVDEVSEVVMTISEDNDVPPIRIMF